MVDPENKPNADGSAVEQVRKEVMSPDQALVWLENHEPTYQEVIELAEWAAEAYGAQIRAPLIQQLLEAGHRAAELRLQVAGLEQQLSLTESMLRAKDIIAAKLADEVTKMKQVGGSNNGRERT